MIFSESYYINLHLSIVHRMQANICKTIECRVGPSIAGTISSSLGTIVDDMKAKLTETLTQSMSQLNEGVLNRQDSAEKSEAQTKVCFFVTVLLLYKKQ